MNRQTISIHPLQTMSWLNDSLVDWANSGRQYFADGQVKEIGHYSIAFPFDSSVTSADGIYAVIYQKLGTKGLLLKKGTIVRELNRSFYHAHVYEYPVAFVTAKSGKTYLIHCPNDYCRIDLEDVETGKIITDHRDRKPSDFFHSRFEISPDSATLISKGWGWHPYDFVKMFDIEACIEDPLLLDHTHLNPDVDAEICTASFINNYLILIGSPIDSEPFETEPSEKLKPGQIAVWDIQTNTVSKPIVPDFKIGGHLIAIDDTHAWELYDYPKIINFKTGQIEDKMEDIFSGQQVSSIVYQLDNLPKMAFNLKTKQVAIATNDKIEILTK